MNKTKIGILILAFVPIIIASVTIFLTHGKIITDFHIAVSGTPNVSMLNFVDETYHWHQIKTFQSVGFKGGYYTVGERPASISLFRYFAWGPYPVIFYGTLSKIIGYQFYTPILINTIFFALGVGFLAYIAKLSLTQIGFLAVLFAIFPHILFYYPSAMLEMLHLTLAVYLSAFFYLLLDDNRELNFILLGLCIILLIIAALFRVSWVIIYMPAFMLIGWRLRRWAGLITGIIIAIILAGLLYIIFSNSSAPYGSLISFSGGVVELLSNIYSRFLDNLRLFIGGEFPWFLLRVVALMIITAMLYQSIQLYLNRNRNQTNSYTLFEILFHLINLGGILFAIFTIYYFLGGRDFRMLGPHIFLSMILLILFKHYRLVVPLLMMFALIFAYMLPGYQTSLKGHFYESSFDHESYEKELIEHNIMYIENENGWCNTVLFDNHFRLQPEILVSMNAGLGLSRLTHIDSVPKSKYIILSDSLYDEANNVWNLEPLFDIPEGTIYLNLDANCPVSS